MEIIVSGHHTEVPERFRTHAESKLAKLVQYDSRVQRVDVEVIHEPNPRQSETAERVEITVYGKGPVIRAEASAPDRYAALDAAIPKLVEQARRAHSRRKTRRPGRGHALTIPDLDAWSEGLATVSDAVPTSSSPPPSATPPPLASAAGAVEIPLGDSPVVIREKTFAVSPMSVEDAIYQMELVGHPFFLFVDAGSGRPSVLYHRHGWTYGVIRVETPAAAPRDADPPDA
ncbi:MAG: ribosome-associated translation inhibitor RaiA [Bifidobacteriaceae bacterium]|jgi:ribosomal subunit interface protein|nr:ribosome-associated translation inhibitor RaiA [Bifidobacteriaceae bacterium]